jgi:hypothetical protein
LQQAKDSSAHKVLAEMQSMTRLDENQFAAAYAFAASPARWALERHDWKAAAALETRPHGSRGTGFETWKRWCITRGRLVRRAPAMRLQRADRQ